MLTYPLDQIPFSMAGSFLLLTTRNTSNSHRLLYKTSSRRAVNEKFLPFDAANFFEIALLRDGAELPYSCTAQPHRLDLQAEGGGATLVFADPHTILFEAQGVTLRFVPYKTFAAHYSPRPDQVYLVDWAGRGTHIFRAGPDTELALTVDHAAPSVQHAFRDKPCQVDFTGPRGAVRFSPYETLWQDDFPELERALQDRAHDYARWEKHQPAAPPKYQAAAQIAWFLLWNCQAPATGALTRPAIYMSKFWMNAVWAWDNCFNALAVAHADPALAWDQLLLFFDHQDPNGMVPDMICDLDALYHFTKPPIHGWTVRKLIEIVGPKKSLPSIEQLYKPIRRLTEWWYDLRDFDDDGMCQYHHGNDSGWDNATAFDQGYPSEAADLAAHLVLQCEGLSTMAKLLGKKVASLRWQKKAEWQLEALLKQGVKDQHFFSPLDGQQQAEDCHSLLNAMPAMLGSRLPKKLLKALVHDLRPGGPFLTEWGLATESPQSPKYEADGYWRGPIWAPSTYLIYDGLAHAGETKLAHTIAERFCELCLHSPGFWENYDALTGQGLRCPGYSWTAAVFLLLAMDLAKESAGVAAK